MSASNRYPKGKSNAAAVCAAAFVSFLVYSAPHRVHHFFDQAIRASHNHSDAHHNKSNHHENPTKDPDCAFQVSANRCVFGQIAQTPLLTLAPIVHNLFVFHGNDNQQGFLASIFHIRAPPIV
jgi:hypothetical protein